MIGVTLFIVLALVASLAYAVREVARARLAMRQLSERLECLALAVDSAGTGTYIVDFTTDDRASIQWSPHHERLFGFKPGTFDGTKESFRSRLHPDDRERVVEALAAARADGLPYEIETRVVWPDGSVHWVRSCGRHYLDRAGRPLRSAGTVAEVTQHKLAEEALRRAIDRADAASRAKDVFLAHMSHEIRTPLTAVIGFTEIIRDDGLPPAQVAALADRILANGRHLLTLVEEILDLTAIETGKLNVTCVPVAPAAVLADVASLLDPMAKARGIALVMKKTDTLPPSISTDPGRLKQILVNVVGNAVKFTAKGAVTVEATAERGLLTFLVDDTGIGIPAAMHDRIFEPFVQADASIARSFGGTGLGLPLARRLARALGGDVALTKSDSAGSRFTVTIDGR